MDPRCASSFICYGTTEPSSWLWEKQFNLYLDEDKIIRCKGWINNADTTEESKNPILLPSRHRYTELLIREGHDHAHHNGVRETLNAIRETHWVLKGREAVKRVIRKCTICRRHEGKTIHCSRLPWLAYRSCLWGTAFHVHRDRLGGTTPSQFCVTWQPQQSILLPVYMCINTCSPPWVNWEFGSYVFLTSIPKIC